MSSILQVDNMAYATNPFKKLIGRRESKKIKFMGEEVIVHKLSVQEVLDIQADIADPEKAKDLQAGLTLMKKVIGLSAEGAADMTDDEWATYPMDDLSTLSTAIMKYSGFSGEAGK